jgi:hypothetical protein
MTTTRAEGEEDVTEREREWGWQEWTLDDGSPTVVDRRRLRRGTRTALDLDLARTLRARGWPYRRIGSVLGVSGSRIEQLIGKRKRMIPRCSMPPRLPLARAAQRLRRRRGQFPKASVPLC